MSDEEEENFCYFGKPLDPYDEDAIPKRRPISVEDQIATDAQGRRRFHGAFTGGFSAGFFNTVGSLEGWTPSDFKSTRQEKAKSFTQKPMDFMDQEDVGEYGIAPETIKATKEYSTSKKRKKQVFSDGPIPGTPVLQTLLTSGNETIGYMLLRKVGVREKIKKREEELNSNTKVYGCERPEPFKIPNNIENKQYRIPEIYLENLANPKSNTFGLNYKGLDRSHVNLFSHSNLVITDKNNKKFSIGGQAFGVGAFEEDDDDDIYMKEDISNYDFELTKEKTPNKSKTLESNLLFGMFKPSKSPLIFKKLYPPPVIPHSFTGKHKIKKSRFEPIEIKTEEEEENRSQLNPVIRARYLGEETSNTYTVSQNSIKKEIPKEKEKDKETQKTNVFDIASLMLDKFVSASEKEDMNNILEPVKETEILHGTQDAREAAKMKMFGALTRTFTDWTPCAVLCKRFNVPLIDSRPELKNKKRTKNLIFENEKFSDEASKSFKPGFSTSEDNEIPSTSKDLNHANEENVTVTIKTEEKSPELETPKENEGETPKENEGETEAEKTIVVKDITEKIGIDEKEKIDLFKAVFSSSSESESEDEEANDKQAVINKNEEFKETLLSDLVPKIRPLKQGILSNITFQSPNKTVESVEESTKTEESTITEESIKKENSNSESLSTSVEVEPTIISYGPQLPAQNIIADSDIVNKINVIDSDDEWIEKNSKHKRKKSKHRKKEKKKHKHSKKSKNL